MEDIWDVDPTLYSSCKQILKMDPETVYQDILSLTFINDVEEMGSRTTIELSSNGKDILMGVELIFLLKIGKYIHITMDTKKKITNILVL